MKDSRPADIVFRNATVVDGTGAAGFVADVAIADDRILAVGMLASSRAASEIDAKGKVLAPGFIDVHTHDDFVLLSKPDMTPKISQGVTTVVVGNCGVSLAPLDVRGRPPAPLDLVAGDDQWHFANFKRYFSALGSDPSAVNSVSLVGHSTLRFGAMDRLDRPATNAEIKGMRGALEEGLDAGAIGFSTGLAYKTAIAAPTEEVIEISRALTAYEALYVTHMRNEGDGIIGSLEETFAIGRAAKVPVVISHHKVAGAPNFGRSKETLPVIATASKSQRVGFDVYPYPASSTVLSADMIERSRKTLVAWSKQRPEFAGRDLKDVAAAMGCSQVEAIERLLPAGGIYFAMDEDDVQRIMAFPDAMIGSDGLPNDEHPHPRLWGTFPRVLGHYARDLGLFPLEHAVRKMTSLSAHRFGLKDRGVIREGAFADLVLFDSKAIIDRATFENPTQPAAGVALVMVNGRIAWRDGAHTGARAGRALRRQTLDRPMA
ncbi:MAG: D-aminoacylase [Alphaproteobacteria bacterium]